MRTPTIREAIALFDNAEQLEHAVSDLQGRGFDRADISLLAHSAVEQQPVGADILAGDRRTPREAPVTDTDIRQERLLGTSMAATIAAFAAAGFVVATGGALALVAAAAAAAGGGVGAVGAWLGARLGEDEANYYDEQLARGGVLMWVRVRDPDSEARALEILRRYSQRVEVRELAADSHVTLPSDRA
jgi:hypothetical protein